MGSSAPPYSPAFPPTNPSLIQRAGADGQTGVRARGELYELYRFPLTAFLGVRFRLPPERAADWFEDIFKKKFIDRQTLVNSWDATRGRFRTWLLTAFERAGSDIAKKEGRLPGQRPNLDVSLDEGGGELSEAGIQAKQDFEVAWVVSLIARAVEALRAKCRAKNEHNTWRVFELYLWQPTVSGADAPSLQDVADSLGMSDRKKVANLSVTAVNRVKTALREALADEAADDEAIERDVKDLQRILSESSREVLAGLARFQNIAAPAVEEGDEPSGAMASVSALLRTQPERLARLMDLASKHNQAWNDADLRALLVHHLNAPMTFDLEAMDSAAQGRLRSLAEAHGLVLRSLKDLFEHPHPPLDLLGFVKDFGKAHLTHPESPLPAPVARMLYYGAIACALARHGRAISSASPAQVREWLQWGASQPWAEEFLRSLFAEGLAKLGAP